MHVVKAQDEPYLLECVPHQQNLNQLLHNPGPYPPAAELPKAKSRMDLEETQVLQRGRANELAYPHRPLGAGKPGRQAVDDQLPGLEDAETLRGDGLAEEQDGGGAEPTAVDRELGVDAGVLLDVVLLDLLVVARVEGFRIGPVQRHIVDYIADLGREAEKRRLFRAVDSQARSAVRPDGRAGEVALVHSRRAARQNTL